MLRAWAKSIWIHLNPRCRQFHKSLREVLSSTLGRGWKSCCRDGMGMAWGSSLQEVMKEEFGKFGVLTGVAVASWVSPCTWRERFEDPGSPEANLCHLDSFGVFLHNAYPEDSVHSLEVRKDGQGRRCAFVNFERHEDAKECVNKCLGRSWSFSPKNVLNHYPRIQFIWPQPLGCVTGHELSTRHLHSPWVVEPD